MASREIITTLEGQATEVLSVSFSPDGTTLASASWMVWVRLWRWRPEKSSLLRRAYAWVLSVSFSPDGATLASASWDSTILLWDVASREIVATLEGHTAWLLRLVFVGMGLLAFRVRGWHGRDIGMWRPEKLSPPSKGMRMWSGRYHFAGWDYPGFRVRGCDWTVGCSDAHPYRYPPGHAAGVRSVSFSPDEVTLASASRDSMVKLWDVATGEIIATLEGHGGRVCRYRFRPMGLPWLRGQGMRLDCGM